MEDPILLNSSHDSPPIDISPFESKACENYLKEYKLDLEELVPAKAKDENDENTYHEKVTPKPSKIQSRRPTIEVNGVLIKPKTVAEFREAIKLNAEQNRNSIKSETAGSAEDDSNDGECVGKIKKARRNTTETFSNIKDDNSDTSPCVVIGNIKPFSDKASNKKAKCDSSQKLMKPREGPVISSENTVTRSGRVSKKVLKLSNKSKDKAKKAGGCVSDEDSESQCKHVSESDQLGRSQDYFSSKVLCPDSCVDVADVDANVVMYTGAGRHLHSYAIHNYNLLTENKFNISDWQRDFALTALSNNIDNSTRSIYRSKVPLVSKRLIRVRDDIKEKRIASKMEEKEEKTKSRKKKKRNTVWTKPKTHSYSSVAGENVKKVALKNEPHAKSVCSKELDETDLVNADEDEMKENNCESSDDVMSNSGSAHKRKLNPNEEDDLYWEMYGTHRRVKLKLIQTQCDSNNKPQWTSVNCGDRGEKPEETEEEILGAVNSVVSNMISHVELSNEYQAMNISFDPSLEDKSFEDDSKTEEPLKTFKRKRNNSSRIRWELKKLDVLFFEHESETDENGNQNCSKDFCKLGCVCESISVKPKNIAINHCSEINCIFSCICPTPKPNDKKPPIRDESEIIRSVAEKRNGRNLAKKEKEWIQTLVKTDNDEYVVMKNGPGSKIRREVKKPERYREEALHWENVAQQKFILEKVKRSLREKAKKTSKSDLAGQSGESGEQVTLSTKEEKRRAMKLMRKKKKKEKMQELCQQGKDSSKDEEKKMSPLKFTFCFEHKMIDCKCKAKKEKEEGMEKAIDDKFKAINDTIATLTNNLANLTSDEKDQLLSLMRELDTLKSQMDNKNAQTAAGHSGNTASKAERSSEEIAAARDPVTAGVAVAGVATNDDEFMDLDKLSKFIPKLDGDPTSVETEIEKNLKDLTSTDSDKTPTESLCPKDVEIAVENADLNTSGDTCSLKIVENSIRTVKPEEMGKNSEDNDIQIISTKITPAHPSPNQPNGSPYLESLRSLTSQGLHLDQSIAVSKIDFYGFILHDGIGYLPVSQYNPKLMHIIFKDPTKKDPKSVVFAGSNYLVKASEWANEFLKPYIKFMPSDMNPAWKLIKFNTVQELQKWKLFDFKFLRQFSPMVYTKQNVIYMNRSRTLFKLMLHPTENVFKFKQVMGCKLDIKDELFIEKYENLCKSKMSGTLPPNTFLQRSAAAKQNNAVPSQIKSNPPPVNYVPNTPPVPNNLSTVSTPPQNATSQSSNNSTTSKGIFLKPQESLLQKVPVSSPLPFTNPNPNVNLFTNTVTSPIYHPGFATTVAQQYKNSLNQMVRQNLKNNLNKGGVPPNFVVNYGQVRGQMVPIVPAPSQVSAHKEVPQSKSSILNAFYGGKPDTSLTSTPVMFGNAPNGVPNINSIYKRPPNAGTMMNASVGQRHNLPNLNSLLNKKPLGSNQNVVATSLNSAKIAGSSVSQPPVFRNPEKQFIQICDLIPPQHTNVESNPMTNINKTHPILTKSLEMPTNSSLGTTNALGDLGESTENDIELSIDAFKIKKPTTHHSDLSNKTKPTLSVINVEPKMKRPVPSLRPPVPPLMKKGFKKPIPGLKAINSSVGFTSPGSASLVPLLLPGNKLTDEVDIVPSLSPQKSARSAEVEITKINTAEPECIVQEYNSNEEISTIVDCISRMETTGADTFQPITFTPNGEDTITISPIVNNPVRGSTPFRTDFTIFEKLSAMKRLNDGEPLTSVARSLNVSMDTLKKWLADMQQFQQFRADTARSVQQGSGSLMNNVSMFTAGS